VEEVRRLDDSIGDESILHDSEVSTELSLLAEYFLLDYPYWLNSLFWNIPTILIFLTGISLLAEYFVLE
jgi:hypothetical protein